MTPEKTIVGIMLVGIGIIFYMNHKNMAKGTFEFYRKFYTKKNLIVMFRIGGGILIFGGLFIVLFA